MPDITMCTADQCPLRRRCYRYCAAPSERQAYMSFSPEVQTDNVTHCSHYIPASDRERSNER